MPQVSRQEAFELLARFTAQEPVETRIHLDARNFVLGLVGRGGCFWLFDREPEETVRSESQQVRQISDRGERRAAEQLDRRRPLELGEIELDVLHESREIGDYQYLFVFISADEGQHM